MMRDLEIGLLLTIAFGVLLLIVGITEILDRLAALSPRVIHVYHKPEDDESEGVPQRA